MGMKSTLKFKGTYLKGKNKLYYTGDVYKTNNKNEIKRHIGIFTFKYDR